MSSALDSGKRCGVTLIELLVVIAIIGFLIGMLLPAVQHAREAANRRSCGNKLKQLGLALQQFHDTHRKFPPGQVQGPYPEAGVYWTVNHGWAVFLLASIEQQPLADAYHWDQKLVDPSNQEVVASLLNIFQCPSVPDQNRYSTGGPFGLNGTKGACGDFAPTWFVDPVLAAGDNRGVLVPNCMTRMADITDGASNTISSPKTLAGPPIGSQARWGWGRSRAGHGRDLTRVLP